MSWFWRGFQSAVFYYVSCAPCSKIAYHRKRRKEIARSKEEREMEEGLYPDPAPFSTNQYWREEMALGPGPPRKKKDIDRKRGRDSAQVSQRDLTTGSSAGTGTSSADTVVANISTEGSEGVEQERRSGDGWNRKRYQREDEYLWGADSVDDHEPGDKNYYVARNPAVNDLHPPVVSTQPTQRSETRWMLQPPPSARVMEGKERANRPRSGSGGSNGSSKRAAVGLGRQLGERMMEQKRRKGQTPPEPKRPGWSRGTSYESRVSNGTAPRGQRHDRDHHPPPTTTTRISNDSRISTESLTRPNKKAAINIPSDSDTYPQISMDEPISQKAPPQTSTTNPAADDLLPPDRPPLHTIISSTNTTSVPLTSSSPSPSPSPLSFPFPSLPHPPSPPLHNSVRALQELAPPATALNMPIPYPAVYRENESADENEAKELQVEVGWVKGRERWSMDV